MQKKELNTKREIQLSVLGTLIVFISATTIFIQNLNELYFLFLDDESITQRLLLTFVFLMFSYSTLVYLLTRYGHFKRLITTKTSIKDNKMSNNSSPKLAILIPSYNEEIEVIERAILSSALQFYPNKEIVLLLDNPYTTQDNHTKTLTENTNMLIQNIREQFHHNQNKIKEFFDDSKTDEEKILQGYNFLKNWINKTALKFQTDHHVDKLFYEKVFLKLDQDIEAKLDAINKKEFNLDYEKKIILNFFKTEFKIFNRKKYANLSQASNKSMNLNTYIHAMGKRHIEVEINNVFELQETKDDNKGFVINDAKYILVLDADSLILPNYCEIQINFLEKVENSKVAVTQCPYTGYPNSPILLENITNANTDLKYYLHQGFTYFRSSFWVGANSIIRKSSLNDIKKIQKEGSKEFMQYISDRTVIEDTESSMELAAKGWTLHNHQERLAYSQSPHDYGSLIIQRWRWSNGGLILLSTLWELILNSKKDWALCKEVFFRCNFLISIAFNDIATIILLLGAFDIWVNSYLAMSFFICSFFLYSRDLIESGYKQTDLLRLFSFNLMLLPINMAGVFGSIVQIISGKKSPFKRTPKVSSRTPVAPIYYFMQYGLFFVLCYRTIIALNNQDWSLAIAMFLNSLGFAYAIIYFIGIKNTFEDLFKTFTFNKVKALNN